MHKIARSNIYTTTPHMPRNYLNNFIPNLLHSKWKRAFALSNVSHFAMNTLPSTLVGQLSAFYDSKCMGHIFDEDLGCVQCTVQCSFPSRLNNLVTSRVIETRLPGRDESSWNFTMSLKDTLCDIVTYQVCIFSPRVGKAERRGKKILNAVLCAACIIYRHYSMTCNIQCLISPACEMLPNTARIMYCTHIHIFFTYLIIYITFTRVRDMILSTVPCDFRGRKRKDKILRFAPLDADQTRARLRIGRMVFHGSVGIEQIHACTWKKKRKRKSASHSIRARCHGISIYRRCKWIYTLGARSSWPRSRRDEIITVYLPTYIDFMSRNIRWHSDIGCDAFSFVASCRRISTATFLVLCERIAESCDTKTPRYPSRGFVMIDIDAHIAYIKETVSLPKIARRDSALRFHETWRRRALRRVSQVS